MHNKEIIEISKTHDIKQHKIKMKSFPQVRVRQKEKHEDIGASY